MLRQGSQSRHVQLVQETSAQQYTAVYYDKSWGLVIGINDYGDQHPRLSNARNDAAAFAKLLKESYQFDHVITLFDHEATHSAIMAWLRDKLPSRVAPNDRVVIFFAGHGTTRESVRGEKRGYLIPSNARYGQYADYIDMTELRDACGWIPAKHILLILDCCFSGIAAIASRSAPVFQGTITDAYLQKITRLPAWQVLTAGDTDDLAADSGGRPGHSIFTSALLAGLEGRADQNGDGVITASDLAGFVKPEVGRSGYGQTPFFNYIAGSGQGDFVFLRSDAPFKLAPDHQGKVLALPEKKDVNDGESPPTFPTTRNLRRLASIFISTWLLIAILASGWLFWPGRPRIIETPLMGLGAVTANQPTSGTATSDSETLTTPVPEPSEPEGSVVFTTPTLTESTGATGKATVPTDEGSTAEPSPHENDDLTEQMSEDIESTEPVSSASSPMPPSTDPITSTDEISSIQEITSGEAIRDASSNTEEPTDEGSTSEPSPHENGDLTEQIPEDIDELTESGSSEHPSMPPSTDPITPTKAPIQIVGATTLEGLTNRMIERYKNEVGNDLISTDYIGTDGGVERFCTTDNSVDIVLITGDNRGERFREQCQQAGRELISFQIAVRPPQAALLYIATDPTILREKPQVYHFVEFYITHAAELIDTFAANEYLPVAEEDREHNLERLRSFGP